MAQIDRRHQVKHAVPSPGSWRAPAAPPHRSSRGGTASPSPARAPRRPGKSRPWVAAGEAQLGRHPFGRVAVDEVDVGLRGRPASRARAISVGVIGRAQSCSRFQPMCGSGTLAGSGSPGRGAGRGRRWSPNSSPASKRSWKPTQIPSSQAPLGERRAAAPPPARRAAPPAAARRRRRRAAAGSAPPPRPRGSRVTSGSAPRWRERAHEVAEIADAGVDDHRPARVAHAVSVPLVLGTARSVHRAPPPPGATPAPPP